MLLTLVACVLGGRVDVVPPSSPLAPGDATTVVTPSLAWASAARAALHARLSSWSAEHAPRGEHLPPRLLGNFWTERWCGEPGPACEGGAIVNDPAASWSEVAAIVFDRVVLGEAEGDAIPPTPLATGVYLNAGRAGPTCSVRLSATVGGGAVQADDVSVTLVGGDGLVVGLGDALAVAVGEDVVRPAGVDGVATLGALLRSPDDLRGEAERQVDLLAAAVDAALDAGTVHACTYGPYLGHGVPPECTPRPLSPEEVALERGAARSRLDAQRRFLSEHAGACHGVLTTLAPPDLPALLTAAR